MYHCRPIQSMLYKQLMYFVYIKSEAWICATVLMIDIHVYDKSNYFDINNLGFSLEISYNHYLDISFIWCHIISVLVK